MSDQPPITKRHIPELLHDAELLGIEYDEALGVVKLRFHCLRASTPDAEVRDRTVDIRISGIERIAAFYDSAEIGKRYADPPATKRFTLERIRDLPMGGVDANVGVESFDWLLAMHTAGRLDWLLGERAKGELDGPLPNSLFVSIDLSGCEGDWIWASLFFQGDAIDIWSAGLPLSLEDWRDQYNAWWSGWKEHWDERGKDDDIGDGGGDDSEDGPVEEDGFIPVGESPPIDLDFYPPDKPAFKLEIPEGLEELLVVLKEYHEGIHAREWGRVVAAWPNFDLSNSDQVEVIKERFLDYEFGRWVYLRQLDSYWIDGPRACLVMRGVEFVAAMEGEPEEFNETVATYSLRMMRGRWVIRGCSQGWPKYGSAPKSSSPTPWLGEWDID